MFGILLILSIGEGKEHLENIVKEMRKEMVEMNNRLVLTEEGLIKSKEDQRIAKDELFRLQEELKAKDVSIKQMEKEMSSLKDPPFTFACGGHSDTHYATSLTIPYTTLLYFSSNVEGASLDISTGVFTAGHPGSYSATWSLMAGDDSVDTPVSIYLRKNGVLIADSHHKSWNRKADPSDRVEDQGGRTLVLLLDRGDTLDLFCEDCEAGINFTTFCVSLAQFDVV